ncbi:NAD(P)-dependent oxidoreductase [Paraburkholderia jirisanensis]
MTRVLITGAAGHIGRALRAGLAGRYQLRLADIAPQAPAGAGEEVVSADITRLEELLPVMQGVDTVVHLAGIPDEDTWQKIRDMNIEGCYNVFEAARQAGVKRVVFASSNHAVGFHRRDRMIDDTVPLRPDSRYGVSKVFGEALGRLYADKHGMSVACLRIGSFRADDTVSAPRHLNTWISHRDMVQLTQRCIDHPDYHFVIAYGVSNNARNRWSNANARFLGYQPQDDAELGAARIAASGQHEDEREALFHGGFGCIVEFDGDVRRID